MLYGWVVRWPARGHPLLVRAGSLVSLPLPGLRAQKKAARFPTRLHGSLFCGGMVRENWRQYVQAGEPLVILSAALGDTCFWQRTSSDPVALRPGNGGIHSGNHKPCRKPRWPSSGLIPLRSNSNPAPNHESSPAGCAKQYIATVLARSLNVKKININNVQKQVSMFLTYVLCVK